MKIKGRLFVFIAAAIIPFLIMGIQEGRIFYPASLAVIMILNLAVGVKMLKQEAKK